jgi:surface carbohydrate biosynthesis protein (TIGR04326 family)
MKTNEFILVWDLNRDNIRNDEDVIFWSEYIENIDKNIISIPQIVDNNSDRYRNKYLKWVHEIGNQKIGNNKLNNYFLVDKKFSFWSLSSLAQKCNISDTSNINNLIKLFAFEDFIKNTKIEKISVATENFELRNSIRDLCISYNITFTDYYYSKAWKNKIKFPFEFKTLLFLTRYFIKNIKIKSQSIEVNGEISFFDILVHINEKSFENNKFISNYWTKLVDKVDEFSFKINWFHFYFPHHNLPNINYANSFLNSINNNKKNTHYLLDNIFNIRLFVKAVFDFIIIYIKSFKLDRNFFILSPYDSKINTSFLLKTEILKSLRGPEALLNLIRLRQYEYLFKRIPTQKIGFYIQENQPWESMLVYAWKNAGHGKIIGVPHTTVRFWDLRYFFDSEVFLKTSYERLYLPDLIAVNGPVARNMLLNSGYSEANLVSVEALRYLYLQDVNLNSNKEVSDYCKIIICGDFQASTNDKIFRIMEDVVIKLNIKYNLIFKPHPAYDFKLSKFNLKIEIDNRGIYDVFNEASIVITSNISSTGTDAYCMGIPVIQVLDGKYFNMTALRNFKDVEFISDSNQMVDAILRLSKISKIPSNNYFYLGEKLEKWSKLIDSNV